MNPEQLVRDRRQEGYDLEFELDVVGGRTVVIGLRIEDVEVQQREVARDRRGVALPPAGMIEDRVVDPNIRSPSPTIRIAPSAINQFASSIGSERRVARCCDSENRPERPILVHEEVDEEAHEDRGQRSDEPHPVSRTEKRLDPIRDQEAEASATTETAMNWPPSLIGWPLERNVQMRFRK